jgi:putative endonuclease
MKKQEIGKIGEDKACEYLGEIGYKILERNYRKKFGEIDILARTPDQILIFIEVKAIAINEIGVLKPEDNFTTQKYKKVKRMAEFYAADHPELIDENMGWQIDLIAVEISLNGVCALRHYENI